MDGLKLKVNMVFGRSELKTFEKIENGRLVSYGYKIDYDLDGNETGRTKPSSVGSIGWSDGSPLTRHDISDLTA